MKLTKILLVSYFFPPYPDIGGRRWAKFSKYLTRLGYEVYVVSAKNPYNDESLWQHDVAGNVNIHNCILPSGYPAILEMVPKKLLEKLWYRTALILIKAISKGTPYDRSIFWNKRMLNKARELIQKHNISQVVVSCAPFRSAYACTLLKREFPKINLITDLRDPWTWGVILGYEHLPERRSRFERFMQDEVILKSDHITVPVEIMKNYLVKTYPTMIHKIHLLQHAYDSDELSIKVKYEQNLRLVLYGTMYVNIEAYIEKLAKLIAANSGRISLDIYSNSEKYKNIWTAAGADKYVRYHPVVQGKLLFEKLIQYDYVLVIHPLHGINNLSTKFYEIIGCRLPIIYVAEAGSTSDFIVQNNLGVHFNLADLTERPSQFSRKINSLIYNRNYDVSNYSFEQITLKLSGILKTLNSSI